MTEQAVAQREFNGSGRFHPMTAPAVGGGGPDVAYAVVTTRGEACRD